MFPVAVIACGMSLMPLSDSNVRVWDLDHPALARYPGIRPRWIDVTEDDRRMDREANEDHLNALVKSIDKDIASLEQIRADPQLVQRMKEERIRVLDQIRRLNDAVEKQEKEKSK